MKALRVLFGIVLVAAILVAGGFGVLYYLEGVEDSARFAAAVESVEEYASRYNVAIDWDDLFSSYADTSNEKVDLAFVTAGVGMLKITGIVLCATAVLSFVGMWVNILPVISGIGLAGFSVYLNRYASVLEGIGDLAIGVKLGLAIGAVYLVAGIVRMALKKKKN